MAGSSITFRRAFSLIKHAFSIQYYSVANISISVIHPCSQHLPAIRQVRGESEYPVNDSDVGARTNYGEHAGEWWLVLSLHLRGTRQTKEVEEGENGIWIVNIHQICGKKNVAPP
jgi:hypothetical protein